MKIIYAGTPDFAVPTLESLYNNGFDVELVITQQDRRRGRGKKVQYTPVKEKAIELGIEVFQPVDINSQESIEKLKSLSPDFIVVAAFGQIFRKEVLDIPKYGCINVHASLLPKYRGAAPINWAIINGETETGITIMEMEEGLDTGDMISKKSILINEEDDCESIHDKLSIIGSELLVQTIRDIVAGNAKRVSQDDSLSSYAPMIYRETGKIQWGKKAKDIANLIRGVKPWPGAYTNYKDEVVKIHKVRIEPKIKAGEAGEIVKVSNDGIYVNTLDDSIVIEELQFPNKRKMAVKDYLAGNSIESGIILG